MITIGGRFCSVPFRPDGDSLFFVSSKKSKQKKDDPCIRALRVPVEKAISEELPELAICYRPIAQTGGRLKTSEIAFSTALLKGPR